MDMKEPSLVSEFSEFKNNFHYSPKDNYEWEIVSVSKDPQNKRSVYCGVSKKNNKDYLYVKQFKIFFINNEISNILKEIYFLIKLKKQKYFVILEDILLDDEKNCKRLFLIFKGNCVSLKQLIQYGEFFINNDLIRWIIYQISFGLYILHTNNIIHNDIKPSNILINEIGGITICDFGSMEYKSHESNTFTRYYSPPEFLNDTKIIRDEKSDIWALGVVAVELFLRKNLYFKNDNEEEHTTESQLKYILSKFGIQNIQKEEIQNIIEEEENSEKYILKNEELENKIPDKDALDLIKNLLVLNPKKRYTILEVLSSKYLSVFKDVDSMEVKLNKQIIDFDKINSFLIDQKVFIDIIKELRSHL